MNEQFLYFKSKFLLFVSILLCLDVLVIVLIVHILKDSIRKHVLQWMLSVLYCIVTWWILDTFFKSTLHSAVSLLLADIEHCPPLAERSVFRPSTARFDPQLPILDCCQVGLNSAMLSVKKIKLHYKLVNCCAFFLLLNKLKHAHCWK